MTFATNRTTGVASYRELGYLLPRGALTLEESSAPVPVTAASCGCLCKRRLLFVFCDSSCGSSVAATWT